MPRNQIISFDKRVRANGALISTWNWWELPAHVARQCSDSSGKYRLYVEVAGKVHDFGVKYTSIHSKGGVRLNVHTDPGKKIRQLCEHSNDTFIHVQLQDLNAGDQENRQVWTLLNDDKVRALMLENAPVRPAERIVSIKIYERSQAVVAEALARAKGICQRCNTPAPFLRRLHSTPYLEVHHIMPLGEGGEDTIKNAIALCPNCHRHVHFGPISN